MVFKSLQAAVMVVNRLTMGFTITLTFMCFLIPVHQATPTISQLSVKNMDFAMNLYRKISSYHDKNIFFSPLSISNSFAALSMASGGVTHEELLRGLNLQQLESVNQPELIPKLFQLLHENITKNGSLKLDQAMAMFMERHFEVEKKFENDIKMFFDADVRSVDFADTEGSIRSINQYIRHKTEDKITEMISDLDPETRLMLINTIFFQGAWELPFNPDFTRSSPFYIDSYNVVRVPTMYLEGVSMLILLPNKDMDYTLIDDEITAERFLSWVTNLYQTKLEINMPKLKMEQSYSLHTLLPDMGMPSVFSNSANLTKLSKNQGLKVSEVLHKAVIEVDETGTTAAAATTIGITPYFLPRTFYINRPFFFFIYHEETNCLLFMGRVIDPTKN
uniref:Serpin family A member 10 n=1 Tax=Cynoglossus semilaevis TaxID=244447 RepID=A0A3P8ULE5_CYNSE